MADKTRIQWTEATWNPVIGCRRVSEGCRNCYAERQARRIALMRPGSAYGDVLRFDGMTPLALWNGKAVTMPDRLDQPLRWSKPRRIFVNSMSDLFHEDVSFEYIAAVFGVMAAAPQHTFQVLTKRPQRALAFFEWLKFPECLGSTPWDVCSEHAMHLLDAKAIARSRLMDPTAPWPSPNVWLGVSAEDQRTADERIPLLLRCPAVVRWVSAEPLLGPVDFWPFFSVTDAHGELSGPRCNPDGTPSLAWVVMGGESGPGARPYDVAWARSIIAQCREAGVPVFHKQLGDRPVDSVIRWADPDGHALGNIHERKGGDMAEWPEDMRVRQWPKVML